MIQGITPKWITNTVKETSNQIQSSQWTSLKKEKVGLLGGKGCYGERPYVYEHWEGTMIEIKACGL